MVSIIRRKQPNPLIFVFLLTWNRFLRLIVRSNELSILPLITAQNQVNMKKNLVGLFLAVVALSVSAQEVMQGDKVMSKGLLASASIDVYDVEEGQVDDWWRDFMKQYTKKSSKDRKTKEWFSDDAQVPAISSSPVDVYAKVEKVGKYVTVSAWVDMAGNFINSTQNPDAFEGLKTLMQNFRHETDIQKVMLELEGEEKNLKKLEGELKKLQNQKESYEKDIERAKQKIAESEENIKKNIQEQGNAQKSIEDQAKNVDKVRQKLNDLKKNGKN